MYRLTIKNEQKVFSNENGLFKTSDFIEYAALALKDRDCAIVKEKDALCVETKSATEKEFMELLSSALEETFDATLCQNGNALRLLFAGGANFALNVRESS